MVVFCDGCRSYTGKVIVKELLAKGHTVINYTRGKVENPGTECFINIHGELDDLARLARVMKDYKVDAVIHLAAQSSPFVSHAVPLETAKANFMNTVTVLEAARLAEVDRVIMFSSDCGVGSVGVDVPITTTVRNRPYTVYGVTKTACELLAGSYNYVYGMSCLTLRIPHIIGQVRTPFEISTEVMNAAIHGEAYIRPEGIDTTYAFLHLDSLADAVIAAVEVPKEKVYVDGLYNVCDYNATMKDVLEMMKKLEPSFAYDVGPGYEMINGIQSEWLQGHWYCEETTRDLGWKPKYTFESGFGTFWNEWLKAKEEGTLPEASAFINLK